MGKLSRVITHGKSKNRTQKQPTTLPIKVAVPTNTFVA